MTTLADTDQARLTGLIAAAEKRILTKAERADMVRLFWVKGGGTSATLRQYVNRAYAMAKRYDAFGGVDLLHDLDDLFAKLGTEDFGVLYAACR